jgi:hypothetical protein
MADDAAAAHALYARLGFIVSSGKMSAYKSKTGEWKKKLVLEKEWTLKTSTEYNKRESGFAILTGPPSGCTAIDVDDPEKEANKRLMVLMESCTLISKTKNGFHYVFAYDARILQTANTKNKLDTRNGGGCIYVAPSVAYDDERRSVAEYKWIRTPALGEGLVSMPEDVVDFLRALNGGYVAGAARTPNANMRPETDTPEVAVAPEVAVVPEVEVVKRRLVGQEALKAAALRDAVARAGTEHVGVPGKVELVSKPGEPDTVRVVFRSATTRVCPVSRNEHDSNTFHVVLKHDGQTGIAALFVFCFSGEPGCRESGPRLLSFLAADEADLLCNEAGLRVSACRVPTATLGQTAVCIGDAQKQLDRMIENPNGPWATLETTSVIACALCTAAAGHAVFRVAAEQMLGALLDATQLTETERAFVKRAFQPARTPLAPLAVLGKRAEGLHGKREDELMHISEAIVACTKSSLEADVPQAAEAMLKALETVEYRNGDGSVSKYYDVEFGGEFVFHVWRRVARQSLDKWQTGTEKTHELFLFNGATFGSGQKGTFTMKAFKNIKRTAEALRSVPSLQSRAEKLVKRIAARNDYLSALIDHALKLMQDEELLWECGLMIPGQFHEALDTGPYIGFKNGVYDTMRDVFMPRGHVDHNVLVSMTTKYDYVAPDDPRVGGMCAEILEYYATLFASDASDAGDALLQKATMMVGSYLHHENEAKKMHVFLGHEGNNGKSAFAEFLRLTLGDYYATGTIGALTPGPRTTLDVEIIRNYKALVCAFPEAQSSDRDGHTIGLRLDSTKLKEMTGNDAVMARSIYQLPRIVKIKHKPIIMSNSMPEIDHADQASRERVFVSLFGSTFSSVIEDRTRRIYKRMPEINSKFVQWAPFHFLMMLEWLRAFKANGRTLPDGDQHTEGSYANRAVAAQKPEGKLRAWVEGNYAQVPLREKDNGTKLEVLYGAYASAAPPVHAKVLGKILFANMLVSIFPGVGAHRGSDGSKGIFLLH